VVAHGMIVIVVYSFKARGRLPPRSRSHELQLCGQLLNRADTDCECKDN